jgi:hypothetical protein
MAAAGGVAGGVGTGSQWRTGVTRQRENRATPDTMAWRSAPRDMRCCREYRNGEGRDNRTNAYIAP